MNYFKGIVYNSDKDTINPDWDNLSVKYHYSWLETVILNNIDFGPDYILDVGPGFGHWLRFYKGLFENCYVAGIDINHNAVDTFPNCYYADISKGKFRDKWDIVNAIGVLHHIMKDKDLERAVKNCYEMTGKVLFIGTRFDWITSPKERRRKFRPLDEWKDLLKDFDSVEVTRSNPAAHIKKHLDLIVCRND